MNTNKFGKHRSVDSHWYTVPTVYLLKEKGANAAKETRIRRVLMTYEEAKQQNDEDNKKFAWLGDPIEYSKELYDYEAKHGTIYKEIEENGEADKSLAIIQFYGNKALVGWRNNDRATMGMTRLCPIIRKNKKTYIIYRGRKIEVPNKPWGWVL